MISVSSALLNEMDDGRGFYVTAKATLSDGTVLNLEKKDFYISGNSIVETDDSSDFPFGNAIEKTASLSLVNDEEQFSSYDFNKAVFAIYINYDLEDDTTETIKRGTFVVSKKPSTGAKISLTLLDRMYLTDKTYSTNLSFPASMQSVLIDACDSCDLSYDISDLRNGDFVVASAPESTTFRSVIANCAMIAGGSARINEDDRLEIVYFTAISDTVEDSDIDTSQYYKFSAITDLTYEVDPVTVTGVKIKGSEEEYFSGEEDYVLSLENSLTKGKEEEALPLIAAAVVGIKMWPLSFKALPDPTITYLDPAYVYDRKGNRYTTYLTDITFNLNGYTELAGSCKSAVEISQEYSNDFVNVEQIKDELKTDQSKYQTAVQRMNELASYTLGFYYTEVTQEDGSIIAYRHDQPSLADSNVVYKNGIDGFFVTEDYQGTDEATQTAGKWSSGFDSNGNAVLNILYAIGINAGWINTGTLKATDKDGNETLSVDVDTGEVSINASSLKINSQDVVTGDDLTGYASSSEITQTANDIRLQVATAHNKWHTQEAKDAGYDFDQQKGYGLPEDNGYAASDYDGKCYLDEMTGNIYESDGSAWSVVYSCKKQNVISKINLSSGTISLSSGKGINLKSKVFCVDSDYITLGNYDAESKGTGFLTVRSGKKNGRWVKIKSGNAYFGYLEDGTYRRSGWIDGNLTILGDNYATKRGLLIQGDQWIGISAPNIYLVDDIKINNGTYVSHSFTKCATKTVSIKFISDLIKTSNKQNATFQKQFSKINLVFKKGLFIRSYYSGTTYS